MIPLQSMNCAFQNSLETRQQKFIILRNSKAPRLNSLPNIHKPGKPLRAIVSEINSHSYSFAKYLAKHLKPFSERTEFKTLVISQIV